MNPLLVLELIGAGAGAAIVLALFRWVIREIRTDNNYAYIRAQARAAEEDAAYRRAADYIDSLAVCPKCHQDDDVIGSRQEGMDVQLIRCDHIWHGFKPYRWIEKNVDPDWKARMMKAALELGRSLKGTA